MGGRVSQGLISMWEKGNATPGRENLLLLAGVLGEPVEDLVVDRPDAEPDSAAPDEPSPRDTMAAQG